MRSAHVTVSSLWQRLLYFTILFSSGGMAFAQTHDCGLSFSTEKSSYTLLYGETARINLSNEAAAAVRWEISPAAGVNKSAGDGNSTGDIIFSEPGTYHIVFYGQDQAGHGPHKAEAQVTVQASGIKYYTERAQLSGKIQQGVPADGISLSIPAELSSYAAEAIRLAPFSSTSSGIRGITLNLDTEQVLKPGRHVLLFRLSGTPAHSGKAQLRLPGLQGEGYFFNFQISEN